MESCWRKEILQRLMGIEHTQDFKSLNKTIKDRQELEHHLYNFNLQNIEGLEIVKSGFDDEAIFDDFKCHFAFQNVDRLYHIDFTYTNRSDYHLNQNQQQQDEGNQEEGEEEEFEEKEEEEEEKEKEILDLRRSKRKRRTNLRYNLGEEEEEEEEDEDYEESPPRRGRGRPPKKMQRIQISQIMSGAEAEAVMAEAAAAEAKAEAAAAKAAAAKAETAVAVKATTPDFSTVDLVARLKFQSKHFIYFHMNAVFDVQRKCFLACMILITRDHDIFYHSLTKPLRIRKANCKYSMYHIRNSLLEDGIKIEYADKLAHDLILKSFFNFSSQSQKND